MKQSTVKVERGSRGFGLSLVYRGLDHFAQVAIFKKYLSNPEMQKALNLVNHLVLFFPNLCSCFATNTFIF